MDMGTRATRRLWLAIKRYHLLRKFVEDVLAVSRFKLKQDTFEVPDEQEFVKHRRFYDVSTVFSSSIPLQLTGYLKTILERPKVCPPKRLSKTVFK